MRGEQILLPHISSPVFCCPLQHRAAQSSRDHPFVGISTSANEKRCSRVCDTSFFTSHALALDAPETHSNVNKDVSDMVKMLKLPNCSGCQGINICFKHTHIHIWNFEGEDPVSVGLFTERLWPCETRIWAKIIFQRVCIWCGQCRDHLALRSKHIWRKISFQRVCMLWETWPIAWQLFRTRETTTAVTIKSTM